jgi:Integrase core domain/Chromo (CHRromatin Organisation MOdifier) domain/Integrase zinc binding domain
MKLAQQPQASAHHGHARMYWSLRSQFVWCGMSNDVTRFLNDCPTFCQARLKRQGRTRKLKLFPPTCALEQVAIEISGPVPETSRGHRYILVMTDRFSKLTRAIPLKGITAAEVALAFANVWVARHGVPLFVLGDNGSQFVSKLFQRVAQLLGITQLLTTPYHPACNGQVERFNSTILDKLRRYLNEEQSDWNDSVAAITLAYNEPPHSSTGFRPFELVFPEADKRPPLRREVNLSKLDECGNKSEYLTALLRRVQDIAWMPKESLRESQLRYKMAHDAHVREKNRDIRVGDWVFINKMVVEKGKSPKLQIPVDGPYEVRTVQSHTYTVRTAKGIVTINYDRVTKAPAPHDLHSPLPLFSRATTDKEDAAAFDLQEFVVERIISHGETKEGVHIVRVRWQGYAADADTWEPAADIPMHFMVRYAKRKKIALSEVVPAELLPKDDVPPRTGRGLSSSPSAALTALLLHSALFG